jgi:hypothetical protein
MSRKSKKRVIVTQAEMRSKDEVRPPPTPVSPKSRIARLLIVLAGIMVGQAILYGPSFIGQKVLLPVDILTYEGAYIPKVPGAKPTVIHDVIPSDLIFQFEPERRFTAEELHAGRFPLWTTYQYAGSPLVWPKFSPFILLSCLVLSPMILPWVQLAEALVAGLGLYLFCRRALSVSFWPAAIAAWCYPLTGFFVFWQGFPTCAAAYWFPWLLLAVDGTVRRRSQIAWAGLSLVTCLVLVSGHIDVAGQTLLGSGLYAIWCLWDCYGRKWYEARGRIALVSLLGGWCLGFLLAMPHLLPLLEYAQTGARMELRRSGKEERPPIGLSELPQTVLPDLYGVSRAGSMRLISGNQIESSAAIYAGLLATLLFAPLAWCSRKHRSVVVFFGILIFLSLSWCLNIPGLVDLLRLPGLRMMSHNRLVFWGALAILALMSIGFDALLRAEVSWRPWFILPAALVTVIGVWCLYRAMHLPDDVVASQEWDVQMWFKRSFSLTAILCGLGAASWALLSRGDELHGWFLPALTLLQMGDLLWFAHDRSTQADPALYYPPVPMLEKIAQSTKDRVLGFNCFPAALAETQGFRDIRGYDSIDPGRLVALLDRVMDPNGRPTLRSYAVTQWYMPKMTMKTNRVILPPVLDMLGVRYVFFDGAPPFKAEPVFQGDGYWALPNESALPRAFVPRNVELVSDDDERVEKIGSDTFDPRAVAYVESPVNVRGECRGQAEITSEIPTRVTVAVNMETPGLVVLSDLWDKGWHAYLKGQRVPVLRTNHAVRGVLVPAGNGTVEFRYEPESLALGIKLALVAAVILVGWLVFVLLRGKSSSYGPAV